MNNANEPPVSHNQSSGAEMGFLCTIKKHVLQIGKIVLMERTV